MNVSLEDVSLPQSSIPQDVYCMAFMEGYWAEICFALFVTTIVNFSHSKAISIWNNIPQSIAAMLYVFYCNSVAIVSTSMALRYRQSNPTKENIVIACMY